MDPIQFLARADTWAEYMLLFAIRPGVAFLIMPATADPLMNSTVRMLLAFTFGGTMAGGALLAGVGIEGPEQLVGLVAREGLLGLMLGIVCSKMLWVAQSVGAYLDNVTGYNNVQANNPTSTDQATPLSDILVRLSAGIFWTCGGILVFFDALIQTHQWWPLFGKATSVPPHAFNVAIGQFGDLERWVASIATPLLFLVAMADFGLGVLSRLSKNFDVNPAGQALRPAIALLTLALFCSVFGETIRGGILDAVTSMNLGQLQGK